MKKSTPLNLCLKATLDVLSRVAFFVLCYNVVMRVLDTPRSLVRVKKTCFFKYPRLISWVFFTLGEHLANLRKQKVRKINTCELNFYDSGEKAIPLNL